MFLFTLAFFVPTALIFPSDLYPVDPVALLLLLNPPSTDPIPQSEIYGQAALALAPWAILSPWTILWKLRPDTGNLGYDEKPILILVFLIFAVPLLFGVYFAVFVMLVRVFQHRRSLGLLALLVLCSASVAFGIPAVLDLHVRPSDRLNALLARLQESSGKKPFSDGTTIFRDRGVPSRWNTTLAPWSKEPGFPVLYRGVTVILVLSDAPVQAGECVLDRQHRIIAEGGFAPPEIVASFCAYYHPDAPRT